MRRQLATLLRRIADRLYPDDLISMTITDNSTGVVKRYHYRTARKPELYGKSRLTDQDILRAKYPIDDVLPKPIPPDDPPGYTEVSIV